MFLYLLFFCCFFFLPSLTIHICHCFSQFFFFCSTLLLHCDQVDLFSPSIYCYFRFRSAFGSIAIQIVALFPFFEGKGKKKQFGFFPASFIIAFHIYYIVILFLFLSSLGSFFFFLSFLSSCVSAYRTSQVDWPFLSISLIRFFFFLASLLRIFFSPLSF